VEVIGESKPASKVSNTATKTSKPRKSSSSDAYDGLIREAAQTNELPFEFIKAVIKVESNFNPNAVSRVGAMGLMQLMPGTAEEMGVEDAFDPRQNIFGGSKYLRLMTNRYDGDINLVLSSYNAGPGNVDKVDGIPFEETRAYVQAVYSWYQHYLELASNEGGSQP
ncbi:MAG: lytic transglycosylase domain-containing protein, partial [Myxococcota bacterium]|jgi:soluble lytic murein transglycosylase-like protein|nr:lytic transglycosylase domain-containing protein [Myxococcota bacterium]